MKNIHEVIKELVQEGFAESQAEKMATYFYNHNGVVTKEDIRHMATKADIMGTKEDIKDTKEDIKDVKQDIKNAQQDIKGTKDDIVQIRADMATKDDIVQIRAEMATKDDIKNLKWTIGLLMGILIAITSGILGTLLAIVINILQ